MTVAVSMGHSLWNLALIWVALGQAGSSAPCSLSDNGWVESGNLALRALPAESCLFSQARALAGRPRLSGGWLLPGKGNCSCRDPPSLSLDLGGPGPWGAKVELWDLSLSCQNRELTFVLVVVYFFTLPLQCNQSKSQVVVFIYFNFLLELEKVY